MLPDPNALNIDIARKMLDLQKQVSNTNGNVGDLTANPSSRVAISETDLLDNTVAGVAPFQQFVVGSGGSGAASAGLANHPGIIRMSSTGLNSGLAIGTNGVTGILLSGGEVAEAVFSPVTSTNVVIRLGFVDTTNGAVVDGAYIESTANVLTGKTANNSAGSTTGTSYTMTNGQWYRAKVVVNADATQVDFFLYDSNGVLVWTDSLTTNIPTAAGRETGVRWLCFKNGGGSTNTIDLDWISFRSNNVMVR